MVNVKVEGYKEAYAIMEQLSVQMQKTILKTALRKSAKPMLDAAKAKVPVSSGELKKKLKTVGFKKVNSKTEVAVAIKHVFGKNNKKGTVNEFYGKFVHEGTKDRKAQKNKMLAFKSKSGELIFRRSVKGLQAKPYIEEAYNQEVSRVEKEFGNELQKSVEAFVSKNFKPTIR